MSKKKQNIRRMLAIGLVASLVTSMGANETVLTIAQTVNNDNVVNNRPENTGEEKQTEEENVVEDVETLQSTTKPDAVTTEKFNCVTNANGVINEVKDGALHIKSGPHNQNNAGNTKDAASAIFKIEKQAPLDFNKEGFVEFDFRSPQAGNKNRFGVFLGHSEFRKGLFIGYNADGWYWQKYATGDSWSTISNNTKVPAQNVVSHLKLSWDGTNITVLLNNQELGKVAYNDFKANMKGDFAFSCGTWGQDFTDMYITNLHYSSQKDITAYDIQGTVKDDKQKPVSGVNVKIDNRVVATTKDDGTYTVTGLLPKDYTLTFEKDGFVSQSKTVTISNADVTGTDVTLTAVSVEKHVLSTEQMQVEVDKKFPRVIKYTVGDKTINGQTSILDTIVLNGKNVKPTVTSKESKDSIVYTMACKGTDIDCTITAEIRVKDNDLTFEITKVENKLNNDQHPIETIDIPNHSLVSVNSSKATAKFAGANVNGNTKDSGDVFADVNANRKVGRENYFYAFVSDGELSAGIDSNSEFGGAGAGSDNRRVAVYTEDKGGAKHVGLASSTWYYDRKTTTNITSKLTAYTKVNPHLENPKVTVSVTADINGDNTADWQDAAIALRDVMHNPQGCEEVPELVAYRIAMNFGSQAQNPFLKTLDNVKKISAHTDGLGQSVLLKGYGNEGHDSGHPDYADIGKRIGGVEDMITMMDDGAKIGARFGIHVNASEMYTEAKAFDENLARRNKDGGLNYGWTWLDQGIGINGLYDLMSGNRTNRFKALSNKVHDKLNFVYVDVWGNGQSGQEDAWETRRLTNDIVSNGWRIAHEWGYANEYDSTFQHWAADLTYGGSGMKGINSRIIRFLRNHQKDSWVADYPSYGGHSNAPLLGGYNMKDFEGWQGRNDYDAYVDNLFTQNISTKFIQHFKVTNWELSDKTVELQDGQNKRQFTPDKSVTLKGDLGTLKITRGSDTYDLGINSQYRYREIKLDDKLVLKGHISAGDGSGKGDETYLLPWVWDAKTGQKVEASKEKLYHWNTKGGETSWDLPKGWENLSDVKVYKLTDLGRTDEKVVKVTNGKITLNAEAETPYVVARGSESAPSFKWSVGTGMVDVGFNSGKLDHYKKKGAGEAVIEKTEASNPVLKLTGDVQMTQEITGLKAGQKYAFYVGVDNRSDTEAGIIIKDGEKVLAKNSTNRSIAKNYVKADAHSTNSPTVDRTSYFQNMYAYFVAPQSGKVTITLSKKAGEGSAYFDDLRVVKNDSVDNFVYDKDGKLVKFTQDFENNVQGIYPFVMSDIQGVEDNRPHLSEKNAPYTQKNWDVKKLDDVITDSKADGVAKDRDANWSLKTMGLAKGNKMLYHTIPQNFKFEPDVTYNISFDYQAGSDGIYAFAYGAGEYKTSDFTQVPLKSTLPADARANKRVAQTERATFTIVGDKSGDTWFGIYSTNKDPNVQGAGDKEANFGGYKDIVIDNVVIEVSKVQKGELVNTIKEAKTKYEQDYPKAQFDALKNALANAEKVANNSEATEQQVKKATDDLKSALDKLTPIITSVKGVVKNKAGKAVKGAKVILTSDKGEKIEAKTGEDGTYKVDKIFVRNYKVRVEAKGYETIYAETVQTTANQVVTKDITLNYKEMPDYLNEFSSSDTSYLQDLAGIGGSNSKSITDGKFEITFSGGNNQYGRSTGATVDTKAPQIKNGVVEFDVTPSGSASRFGLALRAKNMNDYIYVGVGDSESQYFCEFWNEKNNKWTNMFDGPRMQAGKETHFKVAINEKTVNLWVDGVQVIKDLQLHDDVQLTPGSVGFECKVGGAKFAIDNLEVTSHDAIADTNVVNGVVTEAGVPAYNVELGLVKGDKVISARTNLNGEYKFKNVPYGDYTLKVLSAGYGEINVPVSVKAGEPIKVENIDLSVDKSALDSLIKEVSKLNKDEFTADSWAKFEKALTEAKAVLENKNATAEQVKEAITNLTIAKDSLQTKDPNATDKSALDSLIKEVEALDKAKYTEDSWANLQKVLKNAKDVFDNEGATQEQVDKAIADLTKAKEDLKLKDETQTDKSALENLVKEFSSLDKSKYTENSWAKFEKALTDAKSVLANDNATQDEINKALANLKSAKDALVAKQDNSGNSGTNNGSSSNSGTNSNNSGNSSNSGTVQTGDNGRGLLAGGIATALAGIGATILAVLKRRKRD